LFFDFEVLEDVRLGYIVGSVALEGNSNWKYHSVSSEGNDYFDVDSTNGDIMTKSKLDYELVHDVILEIIASKSGQHSNVERSISVYVRIVDVNDNRPEFAENTTWMVIKENSAIGTFIGQVPAEDKDSGDYGTIDYALVSAPSAVRIDQKSGIITVAGSIDREKESVYHFKVRATDVGGLSSEIEVLLFVADKNDNVPRFELESYSTEIPENVNVGTKLLTLNVVDEDSDYDFSFEIDRRGNERRLFAIDQDGIVYVAAPLDREYNAKHSLRIIVTDQKPPHKVFSASTTLSVIVTDVNDNAPKFTSPSTFFVFEEVPLGTLVGIVNAVDADFGNNAQLQYRVLPASHPEAIFIVDPVFGYIQVNGRLDREKRSVYHLTIDATDRGSPSLTSSTNITIVLLDIDDNESILNEVYYGKIAENSPIGQHVVHVTFEDVDEVENSAKIFAIESGDPDNDFRISTRSGLIVVNKHLDAEYRRVQIEVIDVNDERPRFKEGDHLVFAVAENLRGPYPIVLGSTIAEDRDQDQNGTISYAIVQGDTSLFSVDSQSGKLCLNVALDREQQAEHHLKVQAIDLGTPRLSATVKITILVEDLNDNDPVFHLPYYRASIRENSLPDELVAQLKATDADASENARLRYSLVEEGTIPFRIDASTGIVYTTVRLDRELASSWHLKVIAQDSGEFVQRSATVSLTVTVTDENDNAPIILNDLFDVYIPEGILKNDIVHAVRAYDADENETLTYTLSGPDKSFFVVDEDGAIIASTDLRKKDFTITVTVTDEGGHNASITLNFYSSAALNFPESHVRDFTVKEGGEGKPITTFIARSLNISSYGIQYAIAGGDPFKDFSIHPRSGQLFTSAKVDYERRKRYRLLISAIDQHHHPLVSLAPIVVNVEDINDNRPVFDKILYEAEIGENIDGGTSLLRVNASDKDASLNGDVRYSIVEEEMNKLFRIDENSGEIFTLVTLDADVNSKYRFEVKAVDRGQPALSEVAVVEVRVIDENDNSPKFSRLFRAEIEENSPIGAFVTQVPFLFL
uniref:Cadherin n=1 Tax=Toxocara canis TaxID=6265 RepID=A0A183V6T8_TOXCA